MIRSLKFLESSHSNVVHQVLECYSMKCLGLDVICGMLSLVYAAELQKSTGVATGSLHNAMPKFLGSLGIEFGFRQADSVYVVVPKEFERGMNGLKQQLLSTFVTEFYEEYYKDILPIIMDKVCRDRRKDVHTRLDFEEGPRERTREDSHHSSTRDRTTKPEILNVKCRLRYGDRHVLDRLGYRRQSAFDRLSKTYSPSTTKSRPRGIDSRDQPRGRSRPHRLDTSNEDCPKDRERFRGVGESYDDSFSHSYRDRNCSRHMNRRRDSESPLSNVSKSDSSDGRGPCQNFLGGSTGGTTIEDFMKRFKVETGRMKGAHECMRISGFMHGVNNPELTKRLNEHVPKTMEEMMITTTTFIRGEAAAGSKKKGHTSWKAHDQSKRQTSEKRYDFRGHSREGRGSNRFTPLTRTLKEILAAEAASSGTEGPLVIEVEMGGHIIHRMYVDEGSSTKILYEHCFNRIRPEIKNQMVSETTSLTGFSGETIWPLGQLRLLVTIGDADHSTRAWMNFMILRSLSPYNGIIGRPRIREIQAVPSTTHEILKFLDDNFKVALHPDFPDQIVAGGTLSEKGRTKLCSILKKNLDIFAWQPSDMTEVPRSVAEHRLNIREGYSPVWQKKKGQPPERAKAIQKEVQKLVEAGIIREVYYHDWLSNPVMRYRGNVPHVTKNQHEAQPKKCTFGVAEGVFLGYVVTPDGIKPCPDKKEAVLQLPSPRTIKEVQSLNGKLASLNRFLLKSAEKSLPLIKTLKKCIKKSDFHWTAEAEQAFKQLKQHLSELPLLVAPKPKKELIIYLSATYGAISAVLMTERGATQTPIYFISRPLQGPKLNYTPTKKLSVTSLCSQETSAVFPSAPYHGHYRSTHQANHVSSRRGRTAAKMKCHARRTQYHVPAKNVDQRTDPSGFSYRNAGRKPTSSSSGRNSTRAVDTLHGWLIMCGWERMLPKRKTDQVPGQSQKLGQRIHQFFDKPSTMKQKKKSRCPEQNRVNQLRALVQIGGKKAPHQGPIVRINGGNSLQAVVPYAVVKMCWTAPLGGIDIAGPFPEGPGRVEFLIVAMDYFTKWIEAKAVATITGGQVKKFVWNNIVCRFGLSGIKARLGEGNKNWAEEIPNVLWAHRTMIKSSHGDTHFSLTYRTEAVIPTEIGMPTYRTAAVDVVYNDDELRLNLDQLEERRERTAICEAEAKLKMTRYYNTRVRDVTFRSCDFVYRSNDASLAVTGGKLGPKWEGPYEVTEALGDEAYKLRSMDGTILPRTWNIANLKRCYL
uniref:Reverse transcriptase domain-containing protein n=1 Tax=Tanacetum cinerariifolium TaxID=118510 RepID=A0A6L2MZR0_TANCI|nr:reverse transcriptase domain-containing protein [Tanacetum cinerariifolium]